MNTNEIVTELRSPDRCNECVFGKGGDCYWGKGICLHKLAADEIERLQKELDAAKGDVPHDCQHCAHSNPDGSCKCLPDGDAFSPDYTEGFDRDNCEHWEWRGRESEGT